MSPSFFVVFAAAALLSASLADARKPLDHRITEERLRADECGGPPKPNTTSLPQYLVIGDSISMGYTPFLKTALNETAETLHIPVNGGNSERGVMCLDQWLGEDKARWKVISFNFGLHDLAQDAEHLTLAQYTANMHNITMRLNKTKAQLLWVDTTPVPDAPVSPNRTDADVVAYNAAAAKVVEAFSVPTDDLYGWVEAKCGQHYKSCPIQHPNNVHFLPEGYQYLVKSLAPTVKKLLAM